MKNTLSNILFFLPIGIFLTIFFYYPLVNMFLDSPSMDFVLNYLFTNPLVSRFIVFTIVQAILTTIISLLLGVLAGYFLARSNAFKLSWFRTLFTVPFVFPPLAILMGFVITFDQNGLLRELSGDMVSFDPFSFSGIVFAHVIFNISVFARITESALYSEPNEYHDLAIVMGASPKHRLFSITIPHLRPSIEAGIFLVFLYAFNSFAIVLVLGEVRYQTLEVMIYNQSRNRLRYDRAFAIALAQMVIDIVLIIIYLSRSHYQTRMIEGNLIGRSGSRIKPTIILGIVSIIMWFPVITLLYKTSFGFANTPNSEGLLFSTEYNQFLGTSSMRVIGNTLLFAVLTALASLLIGILLTFLPPTESNGLSFSKITNFIILVPMTISSITLSFAIILTYSQYNSFNDNVWIFILAAHILATLPFTSRIIMSARRRIPEDLLLVTKSFGSGPLSEFKNVFWPYMKGSILVCGLFSFAISIGEFGSTLYLVRGEWVTLSLAIDRLFLTRTALLPNLYAVLLIGVASILLFFIEKIGSLELRV